MAEPIRKVYEIVTASVGVDGITTQEKLRTDMGVEPLATPDGAIDPPYPLESLAQLSTTSSVRGPVIEAVARNTVGLGYRIDVDEGKDDDVEDPVSAKARVAAHLEALAKRDNRLKNPSFTELLMAVKTDEEEVGNGYIEISRKRGSGVIDGLFHAPGKRMRRRADRKGWLLLPADGFGEPIEFYDFGTKVNYDRDGAPQGTVQSGRRWATNEILPFSLYSSISRDYGVPRDIGVMLEYLADKLAAEANIGFFDAGGTPSTIFFVRAKERREGDEITFEVPPETPQRIASTLKGSDGSKRVAIIPLPGDTEVDHFELGKVSDRDVGNTQYRRDIRSRVLGAFRVSPIFIADMGSASGGGGGRYTAEVERAITLEQVFDPEQRRYEDRVGDMLLRELGYRWATLKFNRLAVEADAARRESAVKLADAGSITRREMREAFGRGPLPEASEGAEPEKGEVPFGWNDQLIDLGGPPRGAENRTLDSDDQRGLRPGLAGREDRSDVEKAEAEGEAFVDAEAAELEGDLATLTDRQVAAGLRRTKALGRALADELRIPLGEVTLAAAPEASGNGAGG